MNMGSLEMASNQTFDCVPSHEKNENNLKVLVKDRFNSCLFFLVDDSGSNEDGKRKEVLECSSGSSVSETGESLKIPSPSSSPLDTISNSLDNPGQTENPSGNVITIGASSLVQIWEARSQQSSLSQSQYLINSRTSSGLSLYYNSNSSSFSEFLNDEARKNYESNGEEIDWCSQSERSYVSDSYELANCTPRIRGRQASEEISKMILRDRANELQWLVNCNAVTKFSSRGCGRLQYMLTIRSLERCIAIQERHCDANRSSRGPSVMNIRDKYKTNTEKGSAGNVNSAAETKNSSRPVSSQVKKVCKMSNKTGDKNVLQEIIEKNIPRKTQEATYKPKITRKPVLTEDAGNKNIFKKPRVEGNSKEEREGLQKAIVKEIKKRTSLQ